MKYILIIRHLESKKNIEGKFSSFEEKEPLTSKALQDSIRLAPIASEIISLFDNYEIYCSNSVRALETSKHIFKYSNIIKCQDFNSIKYKGGGNSEKEIRKKDLLFYEQLNLFRKGLFSSYDIKASKQSEVLLEFETRVQKKFTAIISNSNKDLLIFVLHKSPISAILISIARKYYNYPIDFFGYIHFDLGKCSLIECDKNIQKILAVNSELQDTEKLLRTIKLK